MKKTILICVSLVLGLTAFSQANTSVPIYRRFPTIPEFTVFKAPDSTAFTRNDLKKRKPTVFIIFSPECEHCQHETEALLADISQFKNTQIVMITYLPYQEMIQFYKDYKIADYPEITMARDTQFFFPVFFKIRNLPSIFVYDKKRQLVTNFEGSVKVSLIAAALGKTKT
ncbi:MAG: redoxin domain-containing protein [Bacteroidota bacterium]|nr:redoxin domain-containing protein [Bacteroidota bacterium]